MSSSLSGQSKKSSPKPQLDVRQIADLNPGLVTIYDSQGTFVYINQAVKTVLGYTRGQLTKGGKSFYDSLIHPDDLERTSKDIAQALKELSKDGETGHRQSPATVVEYRVQHKNGQYIWLQASIFAHEWKSPKKINTILSIALDITKQKQLEETNADLHTQLQTSLRSHVDKLELALEASQMAIWEVDMQTGQLSWSAKAAELLGLSSTDEITFENFMQAIHPDDWGLIQAAIEKSTTEQKATLVEHRVIWPDGSIHWFLTQGKVVLDDTGNPIKRIGAAVNIDELKQAQAALADTEQKYQAFVHNSNEGIWRIDVEQPIPTDLPVSRQIKLMYKYAYLADANKAMANMYGFKDVKPLIGARLGDLLIESDPKNTAYLAAFVRSGYNLSGVDSHEKDRHGTDRYFRNSLVGTITQGKLIGAWGTQQDVTEQTYAVQQLEESEQRFRNMADSAPVFIWEADEDKHATYFNKYWLDFTGKTLRQQLGNGWEKSVHPDDREKCVRTYEIAFDERAPFTHEYRLRRHDNTYHWILDTGVPRFSAEGTFLGYVGSCVDIEKLKYTHELEEATALLKQQREELIELNKAKDEFISLASHQLRTPATGVKQYLGILLEGYVGKLPPKQRNMLNVAYESNERQLVIIDDLLRVAHIDAGKVMLHKEILDLAELIKQIVHEQGRTFKKRQQKVKCRMSDKKIPCEADRDRLRMALENIIDNASKYTPAGKTIIVDAEKQATHTVIRIVDEGVGIAKKDLPRLYQKFSRIENPLSTAVGGTGLGLYWAKRILDLHGFDVEVTSRLHKGTTFTVRIPYIL